LGASSAEKEEILRQADDVICYMQSEGTASSVLGRLILTNVRITFLKASSRWKGLKGITGGIRKPLFNYRVTRLAGASVESRPKISQSAPGESVATEMEQILIVLLDAPTGRESYSFRLPDAEGWSTAINGFGQVGAEGPPTQIQDVPQTGDAKGFRGETLQVRLEAPATITATMKYCPECGKELELKTKFCWECGAEQPDIG
jgi:hypothetical protein